MVEAFGGVLNLIIWLLLIVAGGYYAYRCLLQTKGFIDQYGFGDGAVFMTRLVGYVCWSFHCGCYCTFIYWASRSLGIRRLRVDTGTSCGNLWL